MAETKIEWADYTFNPWRGCQKVSPGCEHCYADTMSKRNPGTLGVWGPNGTRVVAAKSYWRLPVKWNRDASFRKELGDEIEQNTGVRPAVYGERPRVFCASLADVFEDWTGAMVDTEGRQLFKDGDDWFSPGRDGFAMSPAVTMDDVRRRLFQLIDATPNLDWLLVTKRPENIARMMPERECNCSIPVLEGVGNHVCLCDVFKPRPNVWLGTSVENQATAVERIPHLLRVPAAVRFLSMEPLLSEVRLGGYGLLGWWRNSCRCGAPIADSIFEPELVPCRQCGVPITTRFDASDRIDWIIAGGESGNDARPMHPDWVRSIRGQCQAAGVPFHFKQWGGFEPVTPLYRGRDDTLETGTEIVVNSDGTIHNDRDGQPNDPHAWLMRRVGKKAAGRLLDGRTWDEVPCGTGVVR